MQQFQAGETLSPEDQAYLERECAVRFRSGRGRRGAVHGKSEPIIRDPSVNRPANARDAGPADRVDRRVQGRGWRALRRRAKRSARSATWPPPRRIGQDPPAWMPAGKPAGEREDRAAFGGIVEHHDGVFRIQAGGRRRSAKIAARGRRRRGAGRPAAASWASPAPRCCPRKKAPGCARKSKPSATACPKDLDERMGSGRGAAQAAAEPRRSKFR